MSTAIAQGMRFTVDINAGLIERPQREILMRGDKNANQIVITVMEGKAPANMTGATASGMFIRQSGLNVPITGTVSGNVITMTLNDHCYVESGRYEAFVRLKSANTMRTILLISGNVHKDGDGAVVDVEEVIPSIDDLLAQLEEMRTVTAAANAAATNANTARDAANAAATNANNKATAANTAATAANTAATAANTARDAANAAAQTANTAAAKIDGMTVSATKLSPGANPTATISETGGHKHIAFGIPKGDKGETGNTGATGATPEITFTVKTGAPGTQVQISQGGTAENPTVELTIPRGDTGNIENLTVNGVAPNAAGNVPLDVVTNERYYNSYTAGGAGDVDVLTDTFALVPISTTANPSLYAALGNVGSYAYVRTSFYASQSTTARRYQVAYNYNGSVQRKAFRAYGPNGWMPWKTDARLSDVPGYNLLDNSDFANPVAQAELNGKHGNNTYLCDRWLTWNITGTQYKGYMRLAGTQNAARIYQNLTGIEGKTITAAAKISGSGTVYVGVYYTVNGTSDSVTKSVVAPNGIVLASGTIPSGATNISFRIYPDNNSTNTANLYWAALYEGTYTVDTLPAYMPKGYAAELAECQRYYQEITIDFSAYEIGTDVNYPTRVPLIYPMEMRIIPTAKLNTSWDSGIQNAIVTYVNEKSLSFSLSGNVNVVFVEWHGKLVLNADL